MTNPSALYLPGTSGNYVSTPDHADFSTSDFSCTARVQRDTWNVASAKMICSQFTGGVYFSLTNLKMLAYFTASVGPITSSADHSFNDGDTGWVGLTVDFDNGSSNSEFKFWIGGTGDTPTWVQLGSTQTGAVISAPANPTTPFEVGSRSTGTANLFDGMFLELKVYNGIGDNSAPGLGTLVAEFRADAPIEPRYRDSTGKIWTLNGSAYSFVEVS